LEKTLDGRGCDETSTTGGRNELEMSVKLKFGFGYHVTYTDRDGTTLAALLCWQRVRKTQVCTPVTSSDWQNAQFCDDDSGADSSCNFLGGLDAETNVSLRVTDNNDSLESGSLTGTSLLLDGLDLQWGK